MGGGTHRWGDREGLRCDQSCRMGKEVRELVWEEVVRFPWRSSETTGDILFLGNYTQKSNPNNQSRNFFHRLGGLVHELKIRGYVPEQESFLLTLLLDRLPLCPKIQPQVPLPLSAAASQGNATRIYCPYSVVVGFCLFIFEMTVMTIAPKDVTSTLTSCSRPSYLQTTNCHQMNE